MFDLAAAANVAYAHIIGRIEESHVGALAPHQPVQVACFARIAAQQAMLAELPEVIWPGDPGTGKLRRIKLIGGIGCVVLEVGKQCIDFRRLKAGDRDVEAVCDQQLRQA